MSKLLLIDTFNFMHRAYHALPKTFKTADGQPTNAVYGVTSMIINIFGQIHPTHAIAALDTTDATFRIEDFTAYKAHRKPMEEDFASQIDKVIEILEAFGIKLAPVPGYEADDVIGTMAKRFKDQTEVVIASNDRDLWQLVDKNVLVMLPSTTGEVEWVGPNEVQARMGFAPELIPDYKGLRGDPSDNIPGVYGVGEKTATELIKKYGTIGNIYQHANEIEPVSLREKLLNSYDQAMLSKKLATIITEVPFTLDLSGCKYHDFNKLKVKTELEKYNFKSLIRRMGFDTPGSSFAKRTKKQAVSSDQLPLLE